MKPVETATNIHLTSIGRGGISLGCDYDGARYHVWVDENLEPTVVSTTRSKLPVLFKNPPRQVNGRDMGRYDPGYFDTRQLKIDSAFSQALVAHMQKVARAQKLLEQARTLEQQREQEAAAVIAQMRQRKRIMGEAVRMHTVLTELMKDHFNNEPPLPNDRLNTIRAILRDCLDDTKTPAQAQDLLGDLDVQLEVARRAHTDAYAVETADAPKT